MDIILHIGAHRTGTTSLQLGISKNRQTLLKYGLTFWGPKLVRQGLFSGMFSSPSFRDGDAKVKIAIQSMNNIRARIEKLGQKGQSKLLISEENIMGSMKTNLRMAKLYPNLFMRLAHFSSLFSDDCIRVGLSIRQYDKFWSSSIAFAIKAGFHVPSQNELMRISLQKRTWRDIIIEVSEMFPNAEILVWDFSSFVGEVEDQLKILAGTKIDFQFERLKQQKHNASASVSGLRKILLDRGDIAAAQNFDDIDSVYLPFRAEQIQIMQKKYQSDLDWLRNGAGGVAKFVENELDVRNLT